MATTTTNPRPAVAGDLGDTRTCTLGGIADLTAAVSARGIVRYTADLTVTDELTATIPDPDTTVVVVELGDSGEWLQTAAPGLWELEIEVTFSSGAVITFPDGDPDRLVVRSDLD